MTQYLPVSLTLREPMLSPSGLSPTADATSLPYLPGRMQRGMVSRLLAGTPSVHKAVIADAAVFFAPAYPDAGSGFTVLPTPECIRLAKGTDDVIDLSDSAWSASAESRGLRRPPSLLAVDHNGRYGGWVTPRYALHGRIQRGRVAGRTAAEFGGPFYELPLAANQKFRTLWRIPDGEHGESLALELMDLASENRLRAGSARHKAYGGAVQLTFNSPIDDPQTAVTVDANQDFHIVIMSPALVLDSLTGEDNPNLLGGEVQQMVIGTASVVSSYIEKTLVGGFESRWQTTLPLRWAAAPGSVVRCRVNPQSLLDSATIRRWHERSIGDLPADGYGQFIVLPVPERVRALRGIEVRGPESSTHAAVPANPLDVQFLERIQRRLYRHAAEAALTSQATELARSLRPLPSAALLGSLRDTVHRGTVADPLRVLRETVADLPQRAQAALKGAVVPGQRGKGPRTLLGLIEKASNEPGELFLENTEWAPDVVRAVMAARLATAPDDAAARWLQEVAATLAAAYLSSVLGVARREAAR